MKSPEGGEDMTAWGHPGEVDPYEKYLWSLMHKEWISFAGKIPELSLDIGAARSKSYSVSLDPFPRGRVDVQALGESLPFKNKAFKSVVLESVLKHVLDPIQVLSEARRVLQDGGYLFITSPINRIDYHRHCFTYNALCNLVKEAGFIIMRTKATGLKYSGIARRLWKYVPKQFAGFHMPPKIATLVYLVARVL